MSNHTMDSSEPETTFVINGQYIKDLSFENPQGIKNLLQAAPEEEPLLDVSIQVQAHAMPESTYEVELILKAETKIKNQTLYLLELTYAGLFTLGEIPAEILQPFLFIECPRLLFPFARSILAQITQDSGFPPLVLAPFDFAHLYHSQQMQEGGMNLQEEPKGTA